MNQCHNDTNMPAPAQQKEPQSEHSGDGDKASAETNSNNQEQQHKAQRRRCSLCREGVLSLWSFLGTVAIVLVPSMAQIYSGIVPNIWGAMMWGPVLYYALINICIKYALRNLDYQIAMRATFLGFICAVSILLVLFPPLTPSSAWMQFGVYGLFMSIFHFTEFLAIAWANPRSLTVDSFILNHSVHYAIAAGASWVEFLVEIYLWPNIKSFGYLWLVGIALCCFGETMRKTAILTASTSFTHLVQYTKHEDHKLVTTGVYAWARHPSYVGWFWWSIGTQIILLNPLCIIFYTIVSWKFFHDRIFVEEITLLNFFRSDYQRYQSKVPTGLPFIKGYILDH